MATPLSGVDPTSYESATLAPFTLGGIYIDEATGYLYRLVKNHASDGAWALGGAIVLTSLPAGTSGYTQSWVCTMSKGASQLGSGALVGMAVRAVAVSHYGFVMIDGQFAFALNAANTAFGMTPVTSGNVTLGNWVACVVPAGGGNQPIVGVNYVSRRPPFRFTAATLDNKYLETKPGDTGLAEVAHIGFGFLLTDMSVFTGDRPFFSFDWYRDEETGMWKQVGEDVFFCREARANGHKIYVDQELSNMIGHVGEFDYNPEVMQQIETATT